MVQVLDFSNPVDVEETPIVTPVAATPKPGQVDSTATPIAPTIPNIQVTTPPANSLTYIIGVARCIPLVIIFILSSISIYTTQLIIYPVKFISPDNHHALIDLTKQSFGILLVTLTHYFTPVKVNISTDDSMQGVFSVKDTLLTTNLPDRAIVISNHQLYSDWVFLWYIAYTAKCHGSLYILLKDSLKKVPIWGWGMQHFRFIFLKRKWEDDEKTLTDGLGVIKKESNFPAWLTLFPEGTTFSRNGVRATTAYGKKVDLTIPSHVLLPRARGLLKSIRELDSTIEYLYDATLHYSGIPEGVYGEDYYTLRNMYLKGIHPDTISMYWRRISIKDIPTQDEKEFEDWLLKFWYEKDTLLDNFINTGSFTPTQDLTNSQSAPVTADVKLESPIQLFQIISIPLNVILILNIIRLNYTRFFA